jgi:CDP-diacylglycerol--glycerol-3-phosphate 3-phosphatidyltransferase
MLFYILRGGVLMKKAQVANVLSASRPLLAVVIGLIVVLKVMSGETDLPIWLSLVWVVVALTDGLDGVMARSKHFGQTKYGPLIDELCDKLAVNIAMLALCLAGRISWYFWAIMLGRDVFVTIVRRFARKNNSTVVESAKWPGKAKTCLQFLLVLAVLLPITATGNWKIVIFLLSAGAMGMSLVSGMQILLLAMNAKDSSWLEGTNGKIGAPNWWSLSRIALSMIVPYLFGVRPFGDASNVIAVIVLAAAIATDAVDGYMARRLNQFTKAGKALDPLSDKIIFYPVAVAMFVATEGTFLIPNIEVPAMQLIMWLAIGLTVFRDAAFIIWFGLEYKKLPEGIAASIWDKIRMVMMCVWLGAMAVALCTQGLLIGTTLAWIAFICMVLVGLTLSITSGAVALVRVEAIKAGMKK